MSWMIEHENGKTKITHNGKMVRASSVIVKHDINESPQMWLKVLLDEHDGFKWQMSHVTEEITQTDAEPL